MWTVIFIITTIICAAGWLICHIERNAMIHYIKKTGAQPTHSEIAECVQWAMKHALKMR